MPVVITVIAYPGPAGVWKMRVSGITESQFSMLKSVVPILKRKPYGVYLTAKWRAQGSGFGRYIPMVYITPVLSLLESWGYGIVTVEDMDKPFGLGKMWTFRRSGYLTYAERVALDYPHHPLHPLVHPASLDRLVDYSLGGRYWDSYYYRRYATSYLPALLPPP